MDEMKIKINTKLMRGVLSKLISGVIYKKTGVKPDISINNIEAELLSGKIHFHLDVNGAVDESIFVKLNRIIDE